MRTVASVLAMCWLSACASTTVKPFSPEPGKQGFVVSCKGDLSSCYTAAQSACPSGFDIMDSSTIHDDETNRTKSNIVVACKT